ncbi:MAG: hypothetical protein US22_C0049G0003 [candidate division TM6 bacterium GW2011_GWF2_36_6]|nr:MAG: hypothetical protein US22_C0049G0003 [candidate division TM6 bacterium GW2011_GWF2_36_6]
MRFTKIMLLLAAVLLCQSAQPAMAAMSLDMKGRFLQSIKDITQVSNEDLNAIAASVLTKAMSDKDAELLNSNYEDDVKAKQALLEQYKKDKTEAIDKLKASADRISAWQLPGAQAPAQAPAPVPAAVEAQASTSAAPAPAVPAPAPAEVTQFDLPEGFFEAVNAAFLKIDVLAMPSHVTDAYLISPMQAKYLKIKVAEDLYTKFTEKRRRWSRFWLWKTLQAATYQDKLVTKVVLDQLKPVIGAKLDAMRRGAKESKQSIKKVIASTMAEMKPLNKKIALIDKALSKYYVSGRFGSIDAIYAKYGNSKEDFEKLKIEYASLNDRLSQAQAKLEAVDKRLYDAETLYNYRLKATDVYSKHPMWFDGFIKYVGQYQALTRKLVEPVEFRNQAARLDVNAWKDAFKTAISEASRAKEGDKEATMLGAVKTKLDELLPKGENDQTWSTFYDTQISAILGVNSTKEQIAKKFKEGTGEGEWTKEEIINDQATELANLVRTANLFIGTVYQADLAKNAKAGTASAPTISADDLLKLQDLSARAAELYTVGIDQLASKELSSARWAVAGGVMMKTLALAVVLPIIYVAIVPGAATAAFTYVSGLAAQYPAIAALVAKIQAVEYAAYFKAFAELPFVKALINFLLHDTFMFAEAIRYSPFVEYLTSIDLTMIAPYFDKIVSSSAYMKFMQNASWLTDKSGEAIAAFVGAVKSANLGEVFGHLLTKAGVDGHKLLFGYSAGFMMNKVVPAVGAAVTSGLAKSLSILTLIWTAVCAPSLLGLLYGAASFLGAFVFGDVISCCNQDPEHAKQYYIYYTLMELQTRVAELDLNIARHVDLVSKSAAAAAPAPKPEPVPVPV